MLSKTSLHNLFLDTSGCHGGRLNPYTGFLNTTESGKPCFTWPASVTKTSLGSIPAMIFDEEGI